MSSSWIQLSGWYVTRKIQEKESTYGPLLGNLQILYPEYSNQFIPIIIGALGSIPCNFKYNLKCLGFSEKEGNKQSKILQIKSITGSVKIVKSFLKFKCWSDCVSNFIYNGWPIFNLFFSHNFQFYSLCFVWVNSSKFGQFFTQSRDWSKFDHENCILDYFSVDWEDLLKKNKNLFSYLEILMLTYWIIMSIIKQMNF